MTTTLKIAGMHCNSCKTLIEDVAMDVPGVVACRVDVNAGAAEVEHGESCDVAALVAEIQNLGDYKVEIV